MSNTIIEEILKEAKDNEPLRDCFNKRRYIEAQKLLEQKEKFEFVKCSEVEAAINEWNEKGLGKSLDERNRECIKKARDWIQKIFSYFVIVVVVIFFSACLFFWQYDQITLALVTGIGGILTTTLRILSDFFGPIHNNIRALEGYLAKNYCSKLRKLFTRISGFFINIGCF